MSTLGIYVQVPFCQTKCTYCNFHTGVVSSDRFAPYIHAIQQELANALRLHTSAGILRPESAETRTVDTVYIGGGTPSLLNPELLAALLHSIHQSFESNWQEVTLEADPETIDPHKASQWSAAGIHRISFGSQSFVDDELKAAGRMHRSEDIFKAVPILRDAGIAEHQLRSHRRPSQTNPRFLATLPRRNHRPLSRTCFNLHDGDRRSLPPRPGSYQKRLALQCPRTAHRRIHGRFLRTGTARIARRRLRTIRNFQLGQAWATRRSTT